jgi:hypothetical protein
MKNIEKKIQGGGDKRKKHSKWIIEKTEVLGVWYGQDWRYT